MMRCPVLWITSESSHIVDLPVTRIMQAQLGLNRTSCLSKLLYVLKSYCKLEISDILDSGST